MPVVSPPTVLDYRPADTSLVSDPAHYDLGGDQAECQLGNGADIPSGDSGAGFTDTTYCVTTAEVLAGVATAAY